MRWREIADRPADAAHANLFLTTFIDEQIANLEERIELLDEIAGDEASELADRASFDPSAAFERLRRFQSSKGRELRQTLDALLLLQTAKEKSVDRESRIGNGECNIASSECHMAREQYQSCRGKTETPAYPRGGAESHAGIKCSTEKKGWAAPSREEVTLSSRSKGIERGKPAEPREARKPHMSQASLEDALAQQLTEKAFERLVGKPYEGSGKRDSIAPFSCAKPAQDGSWPEPSGPETGVNEAIRDPVETRSAKQVTAITAARERSERTQVQEGDASGPGAGRNPSGQPEEQAVAIESESPRT
jgi:hypothetical protein